MYRPCLHCEGKRYDESYCPEICTYGEDRKRLKELESMFEEADKIFMATCLSLESYKAWCELKKKYNTGA